MKCATVTCYLPPPEQDFELAGFDPRTAGNEQYGISTLCARIAWFKSKKENFIIISLDSLYFPQSISGPIMEILERDYGVPKQSVIFNSTHTHAAPNIALEFFGRISKRYIQIVQSAIAEGLRSCQGDFFDCELVFKTCFIGNEKIVGRRNLGREVKSLFLIRKILRLPNLDRRIDEYLRVICITDSGGMERGLIVNFSCHPVFASNQAISSDFPGRICSDLEDVSGGFSMFLQGFCGDVRPNYRLLGPSIKDLSGSLKLLFNKSVFKELELQDLVDFCKYFTNKVYSLLQSEIGEVQEDRIKIRSFSTEIVSSTGNTRKLLEVKLVSVGDVIFLSIPAEVTSHYYVALSEEFSNIPIVPMGFADGLIGYLPFSCELEEGGYEVWSSKNYGWDSTFSVESIENFYKTLVKNIYILLASQEAV